MDNIPNYARRGLFLAAFIAVVAASAVLVTGEGSGEENNIADRVNLRQIKRHPIRIGVHEYPLPFVCDGRRFGKFEDVVRFLDKKRKTDLKKGLLLVSHDKRGIDPLVVKPILEFAKRKKIDVFSKPAINKLPYLVQEAQGPWVYWIFRAGER